jgi:hypothetical protein
LGINEELHFETCKRCGEVLSDYSWYILGKRYGEHLNTCDGNTTVLKGQKLIYGTIGDIPEYREVNKEVVKFKELGQSSDTWGGSDTPKGSTITGKLVEVAENANNEEMTDYIFETPKGRIRIWGSAILCRRLGTEIEKHPFLGKQIRLTYRGKVKAKRGLAHDYKVEIEA